MAKKSKAPLEDGGNYLFPDDRPLSFIPSGSVLLDCVIGGGWPLGRISNIVGDKSTGKTLVAIEACNNFIKKFPTGEAYYHEAEAAFDLDYAKNLGMPIKQVRFIDDLVTVEELFESLEHITQSKEKKPILYIVDSLDALSDAAEQERKITDGTFGTSKARQMSQLFRRQAKKLEKTQTHLMVISQIRDKIGVTFGKKTTRASGHALDFYASQIVWLSQIKRMEKAINKIKRKYGVEVQFFCEKNKIASPFRECVLPILFHYGIDDVTSCLLWLEEVEALDQLSVEVSKSDIKDLAEAIKGGDEPELKEEVFALTRSTWHTIEQSFLPTYKKY